MGYRDFEVVNPLDLFSGHSETIRWTDIELRQRLQAGQGRPFYRPEHLETLYEDLYAEPMLQMEYDRFSPAWNSHQS